MLEKDGAGRAAVVAGITADVATVNEINRLEKIDPEAAAKLIARAEAEPNINFRAEVRSDLRQAKANRPGGSKPPGKPTGNKKPKPSGDEALALLTEQISVKDAIIKSLQDEKEYLTKELKETRSKLAELWKPE